jgi:hypothetical protein
MQVLELKGARLMEVTHDSKKFVVFAARLEDVDSEVYMKL